MNKIYFFGDTNVSEESYLNIFEAKYPNKGKIVVKMHFGEPGNQTALKPEDVAPIIGALVTAGLKPILVDTPVAYPSERNTVEGYTKVAKERGYFELAPVLISDNWKEIRTKDLRVKVCKELIEAENLLVITHVKGHPCSGFGGAIKNFGMGGLMKESKNDIHLGSNPTISEQDCLGCGMCAKLCPGEAIKIIKAKAVVDLDKCLGCSVCQINCPTNSIKPKLALFDDLLAQGAAACINNLPKNTCYINLIKRITEKCDCETDSGPIIAKDCGILIGDNPVAIDKASVDLINKKEGKDVFLEVNHKDPNLQIDFATEYTGLSKEYELVELGE